MVTNSKVRAIFLDCKLAYFSFSRRAYTSIGIDLDRDPGYTSPTRGLERPQPGPYVSPFTRSRLN